jgi:hypothetical protein
MGGEGMYLMYDLRSDAHRCVVECKRHRSLSWAEAKKYWLKTQANAPQGHTTYLLFKSNNQPCLVMFIGGYTGGLEVTEFETLFGVPFIKHKSTRVKDGVVSCDGG